MSLDTSITLWAALKNTRGIFDKATNRGLEDIESAEEAVRKAQEKLDTARAKRDERTNTFKAEEAKLLDALQKAEAETPGCIEAPQAAATRPATGDVDVLDSVTAMLETPKGAPYWQGVACS